ncbi:hypothetical protein D9M72_520310 [compost metagenome]
MYFSLWVSAAYGIDVPHQLFARLEPFGTDAGVGEQLMEHKLVIFGAIVRSQRNENMRGCLLKCIHPANDRAISVPNLHRAIRRALEIVDHLFDPFGIKLSTGTPVVLLMASASFREGVACSLRILEIIDRSHFTSLASSASFIFRVFMCFASLFMSWIVNVMNVNVKHNVHDNAWSHYFSRAKM